MKPTQKQLHEIWVKIAENHALSGRSYAEIGRISGVHPSQVGRICSGQFKTFSNNVMQICKYLGVNLPRLEPDLDDRASEWAAAQSSMRRIWDETPEGARTIAKLLNAIAELKPSSGGTANEGD